MILYNIIENMMLVQKELIFLDICRTLNISVRKLQPKDLNKSVGSLTGICVPVRNSIPVKSGYEMPELLLFSGLPDKVFDDFLAMYKSRGLKPISLKAVVTPVNISWSLYKLIEELEHHSI